mgnify:CR=1 FL=1
MQSKRELGVAKVLFGAVFAFAMGAGQARAEGAYQAIRLSLPPDASPAVQNIGRVLARQMQERCGAQVVTSDPSLAVELRLDPSVGGEGFRIEDRASGGVRIVGGDERGLLYGVGKFLRTSRYRTNGFEPSAWRGTRAPQGSFRAIYAATHFMNFYEAAPADEVSRYMQELGLWGANALVLCFPSFQFQNLDDPAAQRSLAHIRSILRAGKEIGLRPGLIISPNQGCKDAPSTVLCKPFPDDLRRRGTLGVNCCPGTPEGQAYLLSLYGRLFDSLADLDLDYLVCWPYDEGGCGCSACWPWGAKGFPSACRAVAERARQAHPHLKVILSTWMYDTPPAGEWRGLADRLKAEPPWVHAIMADAHEDFPRFPLENGAPGGVPLVSFPEISMWNGREPWGSFGANPLPARFERLWRQTEGKLDGGMPYSEGIYEDMNKVLCLQFFWDKKTTAEETLREYIAYEYAPEAVDDVLKAIRLFEETWPGKQVGPKSVAARELLQRVEQQLSPHAKAAWRWRILWLRAVIDSELYRTQGKFRGPVLDQAWKELSRTYHADQAGPFVHPLAVESMDP